MDILNSHPVGKHSRVLLGDVIECLQSLPDRSVHSVVTSPPYWNLRDYQVDGQIGNESTPQIYVTRLVEVFREIRRVLRDDGTVWLNLGDSYAGSWGNSGHRPELDGTPSYQREKNAEYIHRGGWDNRRERPPSSYKLPGLKPKDLIGVPWMTAFALRDDGWWLRSDIVWQKPNPMPESTRDRPSRSHEYIFLLTKSSNYYYDGEAIKETTSVHSDFKEPSKFRTPYAEAVDRPDRSRLGNGSRGRPSGRNKRDVWEADGIEIVTPTVWKISCVAYKGAHFATFPPKMVAPCILASTSEHGCCSQCGAPYKRIVQKNRIPTRPAKNTKTFGKERQEIGNRDPQRHITTSTTIGWETGCCCQGVSVSPCAVLDPFVGSGTTLAVAEKLGRIGLGIELQTNYFDLIKGRLGSLDKIKL